MEIRGIKIMEIIMNQAGRLVFILSIILNVVLLFGTFFFAYQYIKLNKMGKEMKTVKESVHIIRDGEIIVIYNGRKLDEGFLTYFNKKRILETTSFRLSNMDKEMQKVRKKFKNILKEKIGDKNED